MTFLRAVLSLAPALYGTFLGNMALESPISMPVPAPNNALHLTAYSVRSILASGHAISLGVYPLLT